MKQKQNSEDGVFKFLSPEDIDEHIKAARQKVCGRLKGNGGHYKGWDAADVLIRRECIWELMSQGLSRSRIALQLQDRWECSQRSAYEYIRDAMDALVRDNEEVEEQTRIKQIERLEYIAAEALERNNTSDALKAYEQLNKIYGLYNEKKEIKVDADVRFDFGDE